VPTIASLPAVTRNCRYSRASRADTPSACATIVVVSWPCRMAADISTSSSGSGSGTASTSGGGSSLSFSTRFWMWSSFKRAVRSTG